MKPHPFWRVGCWIFGHTLFVVQRFGTRSRRIVCPACGLDQAMNDDVQAVVPWSDEFDEMYRRFGHVIHDPWRKP